MWGAAAAAAAPLQQEQQQQKQQQLLLLTAAAAAAGEYTTHDATLTDTLKPKPWKQRPPAEAPWKPQWHLDEGEDFAAAALRETQEEAGISASCLQLLSNFQRDLRYQARGKPKISRYFLAVLKDPQTPVCISEEHTEYRWAACEEAAALCGFEDMAALLREAEAYLQQNPQAGMQNPQPHQQPLQVVTQQPEPAAAAAVAAAAKAITAAAIAAAAAAL
ncbi:hypothetical protein Efla_000826 [Eimeria flavescens]